MYECDIVKATISRSIGSPYLTGTAEILDKVNAIPNSYFNLFGINFIVESNTYNGNSTILSLVSEGKKMLEKKIGKDYIFTTINEGILWYQFETQLEFIPSYMFINSSPSPWADTNHFSALSILNFAAGMLGIDKVICNLNYGVKDFTISKGSDIVSIAKSLFPFPPPFLDIFVYNNALHIRTISDSDYFDINKCLVSVTMSRVFPHRYISVYGLPGRPKSIQVNRTGDAIYIVNTETGTKTLYGIIRQTVDSSSTQFKRDNDSYEKGNECIDHETAHHFNISGSIEYEYHDAFPPDIYEHGLPVKITENLSFSDSNMIKIGVKSTSVIKSSEYDYQVYGNVALLLNEYHTTTKNVMIFPDFSSWDGGCFSYRYVDLTRITDADVEDYRIVTQIIPQFANGIEIFKLLAYPEKDYIKTLVLDGTLSELAEDLYFGKIIDEIIKQEYNPSHLYMKTINIIKIVLRSIIQKKKDQLNSSMTLDNIDDIKEQEKHLLGYMSPVTVLVNAANGLNIINNTEIDNSYRELYHSIMSDSYYAKVASILQSVAHIKSLNVISDIKSVEYKHGYPLSTKYEISYSLTNSGKYTTRTNTSTVDYRSLFRLMKPLSEPTQNSWNISHYNVKFPTNNLNEVSYLVDHIFNSGKDIYLNTSTYIIPLKDFNPSIIISLLFNTLSFNVSIDRRTGYVTITYTTIKYAAT